MSNRLKVEFLGLCILGVVAYRAEAGQAPAGGNAQGSAEAQQIRQEMQSLYKQSEQLHAQIEQIMAQAKPLREQLKAIHDNIKADSEKLGQLHEEHMEPRKEGQQEHKGQQPQQQVPTGANK